MNGLDKREYYKIVQKILEHKEFQKRKDYAHHDKISVYDHSIAVSKLSYRLARFLKVDYESAAIGGLLHDFYYKPWQENQEKKPLFQKHGFVHAKEAYENSKNIFPEYMNPQIKNIILRHMFPLNKIPPKYIESWVVTFADKWVSLEVFLHPTFFIRLIGFRK